MDDDFDPGLREAIGLLAKARARDRTAAEEKAFAKEFRELFPDEVNAAYKLALPEAEMLPKYRELFARFREHCGGDDPLPASGAARAGLIFQLINEGKPYAEICATVSAITCYDKLHRGDPLIHWRSCGAPGDRKMRPTTSPPSSTA
jgi:hypothetical protein